MASFRVNLTIEVDQAGNGLVIQTPVPIQVIHQRGQWQAMCESPRVTTVMFDSLEQAVVACADEVAVEVQGAVIERPLIAGRITPADVPSHLFR